MNFRKRTRRRRVALLAVVLLGYSVLVAAYLLRDRQTQREAARSRGSGQIALARGNYGEALEALNTYIRQGGGNDVEALYDYSQARRRIQLPESGHLLDSINILRRVVKLQPDHVEGYHDLLSLCAQAGFQTEVVEVADQRLQYAPGDTIAFESKAVALARSNRNVEALTVAKRWLELDPTSLDANMLVLSLLHQTYGPSEELIGQLRYWQDRTEDPRYAVLKGFAYRLLGDPQRAASWYRSSAITAADDLDLVWQIVALFDDLELFEDSLSLLQRESNRRGNARVTREYLRRLWQSGRNREIVARLGDLQRCDTELLALGTMSLHQLGHMPQAATVLKALGSRGRHDPIARAWLALLSHVVDRQPIDSLQLQRDCQLALSSDADNPYFHYFQAHAYTLMGETEMALSSWKRAANAAPDWASPRIRIAQVLIALPGQGNQAIDAAQAAYRRVPGSRVTAVTLALAWQAALPSGSDDIQDALLALTQQLQQRGEPQILPVAVALLAQEGQTQEALMTLRRGLGTMPPPSMSTLLELMSVSEEFSLDAQNDCIERIRQLYGDSVELTYARAAAMHQRDQSQQGLQLLDDALTDADPDYVLPLEMAKARYRELINDVAAADAWMQLGNAHPQNLGVQRAVLAAEAALSDREFANLSIERLRMLTGEQGIRWRLARARWLLGAVGGEAEAAADAAIILRGLVQTCPQLPEARLLFASALERLGKTTGAADQLSLAASLQEDLPSLHLEAAYRYVELGDEEQTRFHLDRALRCPSLTDAQRQHLQGLSRQLDSDAVAVEQLSTGRKDLVSLSIRTQHGMPEQSPLPLMLNQGLDTNPVLLGAGSQRLLSTRTILNAPIGTEPNIWVSRGWLNPSAQMRLGQSAEQLDLGANLVPLPLPLLLGAVGLLGVPFAIQFSRRRR